MRELAYFPGCSQQHMNWDYRESLAKVTEILGLKLKEIDDWTCCGASAAHSLDEKMSVLLPAKNLADAGGQDVATSCPMCFKRLSYSLHALREKRVEAPWRVDPDISVLDVARVLAEDEMLARIRENVRLPLNGMKAVAYYGCQVVRNPQITGYANPENPMHMDRIMDAVGITPVDWSFKAVCCGGSLGIPKKEIGLALITRLLEQAKASKADAVIVCCPLCQSNLDLYQPEIWKRQGLDAETTGIPIIYYTELLGMAFGIESVLWGFRSHMVSPTPLIDRVIGQ